MSTKKPKPPHVWVVEIQDSLDLKWRPWCFAFPGDTKYIAKHQLAVQREYHNNDKFRIAKYVRAEK